MVLAPLKYNLKKLVKTDQDTYQFYEFPLGAMLNSSYFQKLLLSLWTVMH